MSILNTLNTLGFKDKQEFEAWCSRHKVSISPTPGSLRRNSNEIDRLKKLDKALATVQTHRKRRNDLSWLLDVMLQRQFSEDGPLIVTAEKRAFLDEFLRLTKRLGMLNDTIMGDPGGEVITRVVHHLATQEPLRPLADWEPRSKNTRKCFESLIWHLCCKYPIPRFLYQSWRKQEWLREFFHIAGGGNIREFLATPVRRAVRGADGITELKSVPNITYTKAMAHAYLSTPVEFTPPQAWRYGQIIALGGDQRLVETINNTRLAQNWDHQEFWETVIKFFIDNPMLDRDQVGPIIDYIFAQKFEGIRSYDAANQLRILPPPQPGFSMRARTVDAIMKQVENWHKDTARVPKKDLFWQPCGIKPFTYVEGVERNARTWRIRELLNTRQLKEEGRLMHHCVGSYDQSCASGRYSIWAMTSEHKGIDTKEATISVNKGREIVEVRQKRNAFATVRQISIIERWATAMRLTRR